jgi:hypothetical protein
MFRKILFMLVALATISATIPNTAQARGGWGGGRGGWGRGGGWGGGWRGGGGWGWRGGRGWGRGWGWGPVVGVGAFGCWRTVRVWGPWGPTWRRVWVCG